MRMYAPAKINLYLHVGAPLPNGRHPLDSLVVFTDQRVGDWIEITEAEEMSLDCVFDDERHAALIGPTDNNLVMRAVAAFQTRTSDDKAYKVRLEKCLPIAAGIGGGSSDAATTLHLMNQLNDAPLSVPELIELAIPLGGDVPACVLRQPVLMRDDGKSVRAVEIEETLPAILVNPGRECPTAPIFRLFDKGDPSPLDVRSPPSKRLLEKLPYFRNDLEGPASDLIGEVGEVLEFLDDLRDVRVSRMSGSGATCFALFETAAQAALAASDVRSEFPHWWVADTRLGGAEV